MLAAGCKVVAIPMLVGGHRPRDMGGLGRYHQCHNDRSCPDICQTWMVLCCKVRYERHPEIDCTINGPASLVFSSSVESLEWFLLRKSYFNDSFVQFDWG